MKDKKKWLLIVISVTLIFVCLGILVFIGQDNENKEENDKQVEKTESTATPLLYEVTKDGSDTKVYLFGSIHVADERAYPMSETILDAYNESDYLAVEFDIIAFENNTELAMEVAMMMLLDDGQKIDDVLESDTYDLMIDYFEENDANYSSLYDYYGPVFMYSLLLNIQAEKSGLNSEDGIDYYFLEKAYEDGKNILEMESASYQFEILSGFPNELFDMLIKYSIFYEEELINETKDLYESWLSGNEEGLIDNSEETINEDLDEMTDFGEYEKIVDLVENYETSLIDVRNVEMAEKVEYYMNNELDVFVVVGAGHIVGDGGIVNRLIENDFEVKQVMYEN